MSDRFSYEVVDTKYGKKLCIFWDDDGYPDGIKELAWEQTHRSMYNPNWDDAHEKVVHGKVDDTCWFIDHSPRAITLFENKFNVYVPSEYRLDNSADDNIDIVVPEGYSKFFVQAPPRDVDRILDAEFSYEEPSAEYTDAYKRGDWDGIVRIWNDRNHSAPLGLLPRAIDVLEREGYDVTVEWEQRETHADPIDTEWNEDYVLRDYQEEAVEAVLENRGGVIGAATGSGKTVMALNVIHVNRIERGRAMVFVHTKELLYQWADEVRKLLNVEPGIIGDGQWSEGPVTIAMMQTLNSRGAQQLEYDYGQVFFDECHNTSAAETFHDVGMDIACQYRVGLSATPWRRVTGEELYIQGAVGDVVYDASAEQMIDEGYLAEPEFEIIDPREHSDQAVANHGEEYHDAYRRVIEFDPIRNETIARKVAELVSNGHKVLVNVNRVAQGRVLAAMLNSAMDPEDVADGLDPDRREDAYQLSQMLGTIEDHGARMVSSNTSDRDEVLERFEHGDLNVIVSTLVKEGVDIPAMTAVVLAHGGKSDIEVIQVIGRALRPQNGDKARIVDVRDRGPYFGDAFQKRQSTMQEYYGEYFE